VALTATAVPAEPDLVFLPWQLPLEEWPDDTVVSLPRGISRHVVRFVRLHGMVYAIKEIEQPIAEREYRLLTDLVRRDVPCVEPVGVISGRATDEGDELPAALITRHLKFSLPYRALFSSTLREETASRLLDALSVLLVQLHLAGFAWGDCSLSNTLFRRDAGSFAAYLVDAETGELHPNLSAGQRAYDLELAATNVAGELMDLAAGQRLHEAIDPIVTGLQVRVRYERLWAALTEPVTVEENERYRLDERIRLLNSMGFDVAELTMKREAGNSRITVTPKVVDAGHHQRRLIRLTGLDVEENQARRLLNDLDAYRLECGGPDVDEDDEEILAHRWVTQVFEPVVRSVPRDLRGKLEPAEVFHEVLEHRWFMSERAKREVSLSDAAADYVASVLQHKPDEQAVLGARLGSPSDDTMELRIVLPPDVGDPTGPP
jgi:hypothetical protein